MGVEVGAFIRTLHEAQGVVFHLGEKVASIDGRTVTISGGVEARRDSSSASASAPSAIVERAGLAVDRGIA